MVWDTGNSKNPTTLNLRTNKISDAGAKDLLKALVSNTSLTTLELCENRINKGILFEIDQRLVRNRSLNES
ncbi:unnamed protein product [Adineta steineri]|uniref:Uncharacterized protein n=1 Tax=Adineta steineri TaxID=433720 RepID=A0A818Y0Z4_9BILA|nr:unnamed protein product [Adineta steineri]